MKYILALWLLMIQTALFAQKIISYNYTKKDGVLSNTVYAIYRANDGYLWIATDKGISRYNGYEFKHYTLKDGLVDIENFFFYEDKQQRLWIGSYNGNLSYIKNNRVFNAGNDHSLVSNSETPITSKIFENVDGSIIISYASSSRVLLYDNKHVKRYTFNDAENADFGILEISYDGVSKFKVKAPNYDYVFDTTAKMLSKVNTPIRKILRSQNGNSFVEIDEEKERVTVDGVMLHIDYKLLQNTIINCVHKIGSIYYIGTDNGLYITDAAAPFNLIHAFNNVIISSMTEDVTGSIWVGSLTNGIFQIPKDYQRIKFANAVYQTQILNVVEANENLYVQDFKNNIIKIQTAHYKTESIINKLLQLAKGRARLLAFKNNMYVLVDSSVLKEGQFFKRIYNPVLHKKAISNDRQILLNHGFYVNLCNADFESIHRYSHHGDRVFDIAINDKDAYYSTIDSVFRISDTSSVAIRSRHINGLKSFFAWKQYVIGITHQSELKLVNLETDSLLFYRTDILTLKQLAQDQYVYVSDKNSFLLKLQANNSGQIEAHSQLIRKDLIPQNADFMLFSNKRCYIFYDNNLFDFSDSLLESATVSNQISIQHIFVDNKAVPFQSTIVIPEANASSISIHLKTLFFELSNPEYFYSVVNENAPDTLWSAFKTDVIDIYNISAGHYTFLIRNEFNEINRMASFHITKPLYKRPEIIVLFFVMILLISFLIFYQIVKTNKKLSSLEQKALTAEYKSLNSVLNPHFIFNTLSSLQVLIRENKNTIAEKYLLLLSSLIRLNMKNGIKEKVSLSREIDIATKYLDIEKLRFKQLFDFTVHVQEDIDSDEIFLPPLSIQPIVENSIKHGFFILFDKPGLISIDISQQGRMIYIVVQDNGRGIQQKVEADLNSKRIHSLDVIRKRFGYFKKLYNIDISISIQNIDEAETIVGTKVTLSISLPAEEGEH
jgi:hypothetical protein